MNWTAQAITGATGERTMWRGLDLTDLRFDGIGDKKDAWERDVSYVAEARLGDILTSNRLIRFDLLVNTLLREGVFKEDQMVELYSCAGIQEVRVGRARYRMNKRTYLGKYDRKVAARLENLEKARQELDDPEVNS